MVYSRRSLKCRGDACVAPTPGPPTALPTARVPRTPAWALSVVVPLSVPPSVPPSGVERARKPAGEAAFTISHARRANAEECPHLYHHPHDLPRGEQMRHQLACTSPALLGEGTKGRNREHGLQPTFRKRQGRRMRRPYTRPGSPRRFRLHAFLARLRAHCPFLYPCPYHPPYCPPGWKGPGNPPGTPHLRFPVPGAPTRRSVHICTHIRTDHACAELTPQGLP